VILVVMLVSESEQFHVEVPQSLLSQCLLVRLRS